MSKEKQRQNAEIYRPMCEELFNNLENLYQEGEKVKAESEQIEEMAYEIETRTGYLKSTCYFSAETLYNAGYRKQSEGEWVKVYQNNVATVFECSRCGHLTFGISSYCICGAKMKGGEGDDDRT